MYGFRMVIVAAVVGTSVAAGTGSTAAAPDRVLVAQAQKGEPQRSRAQRDVQRGERPGRDERRRERFTEEERRQLHRDLDRARRDIYGRDAARPEGR